MPIDFDTISAREIAVSGVKAQRARLNIVANNIANAQTTRTPEGGAFRRQLVVFRGEAISGAADPDKLGVRVKEIVRDPSPFKEVFDPQHPDANAAGYVNYPNVDLAVEMVNLISAQRAYEANVAVIMNSGRFGQAAMRILDA